MNGRNQRQMARRYAGTEAARILIHKRYHSSDSHRHRHPLHIHCHLRDSCKLSNTGQIIEFVEVEELDPWEFGYPEGEMS
jgi:hypothetical protein